MAETREGWPDGIVVSSCGDLNEDDREIIRQMAWKLYDDHKANPDTSKQDAIINRIRAKAQKRIADRSRR